MLVLLIFAHHKLLCAAYNGFCKKYSKSLIFVDSSIFKTASNFEATKDEKVGLSLEIAQKREVTVKVKFVIVNTHNACEFYKYIYFLPILILVEKCVTKLN